MASYEYQGVSTTGAAVAGVVDATDRRSAIALLRQRGHYVTELTPRQEGRISSEKTREKAFDSTPVGSQDASPSLNWLRRGRPKDTLAIISQLSTALRAGLPLVKGLEIIEQQQSSPTMKAVVRNLRESVNHGAPLSEAMTRHTMFGPLTRAMIHAGETGGILEETSAQLAQLLSREQKIRTNLRTASAYPQFVLAVGLVSIIVVVTWILPRIVATMAESAVLLPWPTRLLLYASDTFRQYGWLAVMGVIVAIWLGRRWVKTKRGRWDGFKLRLPLFNKVLRAVAVGRFARTLGSLCKSGVTILEALRVVRDTLGNEVLGRDTDVAIEDVRMGKSLADALARSGRFPPLLVQVTAMGEQTGKLDELLLSAAETFDDEADAAIARFMAVLPVLLMLGLALVIGFIVAATLLPIMMMQLNAGGL